MHQTEAAHADHEDQDNVEQQPAIPRDERQATQIPKENRDENSTISSADSENRKQSTKAVKPKSLGEWENIHVVIANIVLNCSSLFTF